MRKNSFIKFAAILILLAFLPFVQATTLASSEDENGQILFTDEMTVVDMANVYHEKMNKLFNKKAKLLLEGKKDEIDESVPEDGAKTRLAALGYEEAKAYCNANPDNEDCKKADEKCLELENNISTFCVGVEGARLYDKFQQAMSVEFNSISEADFDNFGLEEASIDELANFIDKKNSFINGSLAMSKTALDMTLAAYNELRLSYALHKEYKLIIKKLLDYRDKLADVRKYVETYPDKFIDASTPYCQ